MSDEQIFCMYFSSVAGWQYHPGSGHGEHKILTPEQAAKVAYDMLDIHRQYFPRPDTFIKSYGHPLGG